MRAMKLFAPGDFRLVEIEKPTAGPLEVLIEVKQVGICASDVHWYEDGRIGETVMTEPLILGHEFSGVIAEVGEGVSSVKPGDKVAVEPAIPCYECDTCMRGEHNICPSVLFCGTPPTDGAFREYITWPSNLVVRVPPLVGMGEAAMLEPLAIGVYAVDLAGDIRGRNVGVLGVGAIGLSILQAARAEGCGRAIATDLLANRLDLALGLGADSASDANAPDVVDQVKAATGGAGLDVVFEAAGRNEAVVQAVGMAKPGGIVILGGIPDDDRIVLPAGTVRRKGLTIKMLRRSRDTLRRAVRMLEEGKADVAAYITHRFPLEELAEAFEVARTRRDGAVRVIVEVS